MLLSKDSIDELLEELFKTQSDKIRDIKMINVTDIKVTLEKLNKNILRQKSLKQVP